MGLTVSELAQAAGVATDTVRYWEKARLLPVPPRAGNGYRTYEPDTTERLRFIRGGQRAGLRLRDIRELLDIRDHGACPCGHTQSVLARRITEVDHELERLRTLRQQLVALQQTNDACPTDPAESWPCEDHLINLGGGETP